MCGGRSAGLICRKRGLRQGGGMHTLCCTATGSSMCHRKRLQLCTVDGCCCGVVLLLWGSCAKCGKVVLVRQCGVFTGHAMGLFMLSHLVKTLSWHPPLRDIASMQVLQGCLSRCTLANALPMLAANGTSTCHQGPFRPSQKALMQQHWLYHLPACCVE
jgi:hypothetical protein